VVEVDEHDLYDDYDLYEDKLTTHQRIQLKLRQLFSRAGSERNNRLKEGYMRQHAFAFFVLDQSLAHSDYPNHTRARYWLGKGQEDADWMDLMMWSVLMGHFKLSRMLWLKTSTPLRAAVVAARLCQKMSLKAGPANVEALQEQSKVYESWALGILNQVTKSDEDVMNLLTCVPTRTIPNNSANPNAGKKVPLWSVSVLDEAGKAIYPCRSFVAHRHCSFLIDQYWHGVYRGSKAAIPEKTSYLRVLLHSVLHFVNLPFIICGCSLPASAFPIKVKQPHFFHAAREKEEEGQEDEDEDELEEDYFAEERAHDETALRQASFEYWLAYLNIPKVKFVFHAAASLATNVLLALWLCFQHSSGDPAYFFGERTGEVVHDWYVQYTLELVFWVCYAGRVIEETSQFLGSTPSVYFSQFWNRVDLTLVLVNSIALGLRVYDLLHLRPCVRDALATMHTDGAESQITHRYGGECTYDNWRAMDQLQRDFQVLGMVLLQFRYLEILTAASWFAEVWLVLVAMVADAGPVLFLMLFFALATGLAMIAGTMLPDLPDGVPEQPPPMAPPAPSPAPFPPVEGYVNRIFTEHFTNVPPPPPPEGFFEFPWAIGLWAALGEIGDVLGNLYSDDYQNPVVAQLTHFNWYPVLLFVTTFAVTVFLENLLIAKMTSTYDYIRQHALDFKAHQSFDLVNEFKDERGPAPPFNIVTLLTDLLSLFANVRKKLGVAEPSHTDGYSVRMSKRAALRVQGLEGQLQAKYDIEWNRGRDGQQSKQVRDLHELIGSLQGMAKTTERLESDLFSVKTAQEGISSKLDALEQAAGTRRNVLSIPPEEVEVAPRSPRSRSIFKNSIL